MSEFIVKHELHPVVERTFTFEEPDAALGLVQSGNFACKIVTTL